MAPAPVPPPPWSELLPELLDLVVARLPHTRDRARFRAVCRSWNSVRSPPQLPWLVHKDRFMQVRSSTQDDDNDRRFIPGFEPTSALLPRFLSSALRFISTTCADLVMSLAENNNPWGAAAPLPGFLCSGSLCPHHARCVGSTGSWLAIQSIDSEKKHTYYLQNVFSKTTVSLPELEPVLGNVSRLFQIYKVLIRSTPDDLVAITTNNWNHPIVLVRPGKGLWLPEPQTAPFIHIIDIAFLGDKLYAATRTEGLISFLIAFHDNGIPMVTGVEHVIMPQINDYPLLFFANEGDGEIRSVTGDGMVDKGFRFVHPADDDEVAYDDVSMLTHYLVESQGKLLMVRRQIRYLEDRPGATSKVEVFEAIANAGTWVPLSSRLNGQALFIGKCSSKSILAGGGEVEEDSIYFNDSYGGFNTISENISVPDDSMWVFPPGFF